MVPISALRLTHTSMPSFENARNSSAEEICRRIADRVRAERRKLQLSQQEFAGRCQIPLRTYKRFELGECDSLATFIKIVAAFDRVVALELLFPPKQVDTVPRTAVALLNRLVQRLDEKV
ncbi:helix-turn-helix transcriptional regulator [Trinickia symbiotica]|uniref:helix-turn-helix transcriptional regulator n=1 Tax=Trinickia symbiotica TaxID=863227 RepID=UPI0011AF9EBF|nr:helix-turn-helix transcriptional regulator [Trinickia symbiotica]